MYLLHYCVHCYVRYFQSDHNSLNLFVGIIISNLICLEIMCYNYNSAITLVKLNINRNNESILFHILMGTCVCMRNKLFL